MILFYVLIFWYWFGFVKMKKLLFLTPLLNFSHIALHPVSKSEASLRGSHGGTFRYPLDRKASQKWVQYGQALTLQNCYFYYYYYYFRLGKNLLIRALSEPDAESLLTSSSSTEMQIWHLIHGWLENALF